MENEHNLPDEVEDMPKDNFFGDLVSFSDSELDSFGSYDTFRDGTDLYLGDGKNVYRVRKRLLADKQLVLTADCVGVCNPDEYDLIDDNEGGFDSVVGYVESDFAYYDDEEGFVPSPAETKCKSELDVGSNAAENTVRRVLED